MKRVAAPKSWPISRKGSKFVTRPLPGPHSLETGIPINIILKDILKLAKTSREVKTILNDGKVSINGITRKEPKFNAGILDIVNLKGVGNYIILFDSNGKLRLKETKNDEKTKFVKIMNKTVLRGKVTQLNFIDGTNLLIDKDAYKVGDSLILDGKSVVKHLKFEKGATVYLTGGKHVGKLGILDEIKSFKGMQQDKVVLNLGKEKAETLKKYAVVVDKGFENE
ncbi:30S ribosomal protein S4e [Candidatus Woesearchaeota archaeon]|nr:30S ribosomal protein S4e [Candidatus Woesearchaeota archaeon]